MEGGHYNRSRKIPVLSDKSLTVRKNLKCTKEDVMVVHRYRDI